MVSSTYVGGGSPSVVRCTIAAMRSCAVLAVIGRGPIEHLVQDHPERVHVRAAVDGRACTLLRGHVFQRADDAADWQPCSRAMTRSRNP